MASGPTSEEVIDLKIVMLGDVCVGKSSLVNQFVSKTFVPNLESTVRISFQTKNLVLDGTYVQLRVWDTAGQEKYRSLAPIYYRGADAAIIVYDCTRKDTFKTLKYWVRELQGLSGEAIVIGVAANKVDVEPEKREVSAEEGREYARQIGAIFYETSARSDVNVTKLFLEATKCGLNNRRRRGNQSQVPKGGRRIQRREPQSQEEESCAC